MGWVGKGKEVVTSKLGIYPAFDGEAIRLEIGDNNFYL